MFSQANVGADPRTGLESIIFATINTNSVGTFFNKPKDIAGNIYVFEGWKNMSKIVIGEQVFKLRNINFNIKTNNFESQIGKDSIFAFNTTNVDHIFINNRKFKSFYVSNQDKNKNFEIIYDGEEIKILKGYEVGIKYNEPDPLMIKKNVDNYFTTATYYIRKDEDIKQIKLKKKSILALFNNKSDLVGKYVKENKLSYKKEKDLNKMFIYYDSL
jgi:hypothetical protein